MNRYPKNSEGKFIIMHTVGLSLAKKLLISMPCSYHSKLGGYLVIYIYEHSFSGTKGVIINKPSSHTLGDLFERLEIPIKNIPLCENPIMIGGMTQKEKGSILASLDGEVILSTAKEVLEDLATGLWTPDHFLFFLGSVTWEAGELDREMASNYWLVAPTTHDLLFIDPFASRWHNAGLSLGVNLDIIPQDVIGHA